MKQPKKTNLKVAIDVSPLLVNKTGVAYYTERLISHLSKLYPDIHIVGFYYNFLGRKPADHFPQASNISYRPVRFIPSKIVYQLRRWGIEVPAELLIKEQVDFILFPNFLGYPSLRHTPSAPVVHDLTYIDLPQYVAAKNGKDLQRFVPVQLARSSFVATVSDFSKTGIVNHYGIPASNVVVTHIPPEHPHARSESECRQKLAELKLRKPYILFVGTIEPRKNIPALIDAYALLPPKIRDTYSLVIAGRIGWNCEKEIARLASAKAEGLDVIHLGYVDDTAKAVLFQKASLFAHASEYEGFGMPILEAMSYGIPCCISDIPVFREVAQDAAVYFDHNQVSTIAAQIEACLEKPQILSKMSDASRKRANSFSWEEATRRLIEKIKQATSRG